MSIGHMNISQDGIDMIKSFEGFRAQSYKCVVTERYFTIGYGHYGPDVRLGQVITKAEGERLLQEDLNTLFGESLNIDGSFGPLTQEAMYRAQETLKIGVDGIYGPISEEGFKKRARERGFTIR